jgi:hypothetical protein
MRKYLETLLQEKGIDQDYLFKADGDVWGTTIISVKEIVDYICKSDREAQKAARQAFVNIDFNHGDVKEFFQYLTNFISK